MAQKTLNAGPPKYVAAVVGPLTPRAFRNALLVRLARNYTSLPRCLGDAFEGIRRTTIAQSIHAFHPFRLLGDLCCLTIAFFALPPAPLLALLLVAVAVLIWRDGHIEPAEPSAAEAATDALVVAPFIVASQILVQLMADSVTLGSAGLWMGLSMGMVMISGWRFVFRLQHASRPPDFDAYRSPWRTNALWLAGGVALLFGNTQIVAATQGARDFLFIVAPIVLFSIDYRLRSDARGAVVDAFTPVTLFGNIEKLDLAAKQNRLIRDHSKSQTRRTWSRCFQPLLWISLAFPAVSAVAAVAFGRIPVENLNWLQLAFNSAALLTLFWMWGEVKDINRRAALDIQQRLDAAAEVSVP